MRRALNVIAHKRTSHGTPKQEPAPASHNLPLQGKVILIVQRRSGSIARNLATALEANGACVQSTNNIKSAAAFVDEP